MPIACPQCQAQNADGARFCRACGTTLVAAPPPAEPLAATGVSCDDCGHLNAAGTRYCAKCGYSLVGTVIVSRRDSALGGLAPAHEVPPTLPPARAGRIDEDSDSFDALSAPTQAMNMGAGDSPGRFSQMAAGAAADPAPGAAPSRSGLWIILGLVGLLALGGGGWWLMKPAAKPADAAAAPAQPAPAVAQPSVAPPAAAPTPAPTAAAEPAPAAAPPVAPTVAPPVAATPPAPVAPPPQAAPPVTATQPPVGAVDPAREAALKAARDKAARERADRDARATQALAERERDLARQRAEQERARAAQQAPARPVPATVAPAPAAAPTAQSVKEVCAGRNPISQALCESRECRKPEHTSEAICKQLKEAEDRRLYQ